jgi:hypothetical protein
MSETQTAHQRFVEFAAAFYRQAGRELLYFECDGQVPIAFEALVGDVKFSVGYDPAAARDANLFVYCVLGPIPPHQEGPVLRRLLELNLSLAREHDATYCVDSHTQEAACYLRRNLAQVDVGDLCEEMVRVAQRAEEWRQGYYLSDSSRGDAGGDASMPSAWALVA